MLSSVIIADDQPVVIAGVEAVLKKHRYDVVARVHDTDTLLHAVEEAECDVVITEFCLPEGVHPDGVAMIRKIRTVRPDIGIVVMTSLTNSGLLRRLLDMGVASLFDKRSSMRDMPLAVHSATMGRTFLSPAIRRLFYDTDCQATHSPFPRRLSPREVEVLRAYAQGHTLMEIGAMMTRSIKTISRQKRSAMAKLGLQNDAQFYQYLANARAGVVDDWEIDEDAVEVEDDDDGDEADEVKEPLDESVAAAKAATTYTILCPRPPP
ncbi:response regulator [Bacillus sp. NP157]|nr:response regulator [Bacillus sp. NP157]